MIREITFELNNFREAKVLSYKDTVAQSIINLFFMRPGNIPSLPHVGLDITSYLYKLEDEIDEEEFKQKIYTQCSALSSYITIEEVQMAMIPYEGYDDVLLIILPVNITGEDELLVIGFAKDFGGQVLSNYQFQDREILQAM